jgi:hypothetical protein
LTANRYGYFGDEMYHMAMRGAPRVGLSGPAASDRVICVAYATSGWDVGVCHSSVSGGASFALVWLTGLLAGELGGGRFAQAVAATLLYDTKQRGLVLTVFPSGQKTFSLYRRINGRPERIAIGRYPDFSIERARNKVEKLNGEIADGGNPAEDRRAVRGEMTLGEMFSDYLENYAKLRKRTWKKDLSTFNRHLASLSDRRVSDSTKSDLVALHRRIGARAPYAANRTLD